MISASTKTVFIPERRLSLSILYTKSTTGITAAKMFPRLALDKIKNKHKKKVIHFWTWFFIKNNMGNNINNATEALLVISVSSSTIDLIMAIRS